MAGLEPKRPNKSQQRVNNLNF